jgi:hypothetical protein
MALTSTISNTTVQNEFTANSLSSSAPQRRPASRRRPQRSRIDEDFGYVERPTEDVEMPRSLSWSSATSRKSIIAAAAFVSLALVFLPAAASAKGQGGKTNHGPRTDITRVNTAGSFNGSAIKIGVKPRIKKDLGLHVRCRREPAMNELGVRFTRHTNCVLW